MRPRLYYFINLRSILISNLQIQSGATVWCPFEQSDITEIENIQKKATKLVIKLKNKLYRKKLFHLNLSNSEI